MRFSRFVTAGLVLVAACATRELTPDQQQGMDGGAPDRVETGSAGGSAGRDVVDISAGTGGSAPAAPVQVQPAATTAVVPLNPLGARCSNSSECASGSCADGVCCTSSDCGTCASCALKFQEGRCQPLPAQRQDEVHQCVGARACDGQGACKLAAGSACLGSAECASGTCVDGVCCTTACTEQCYSCNQPEHLGTCRPLDGQDDVVAAVSCAGAFTCAAVGDPRGAGCRLRDGQSCNTDVECASGRCRSYYLDRDGDGYGRKEAAPVRRCDRTPQPPPGYSATDTDCCDSDRGTNPGLPPGTYFSRSNACGSYDWDCSGRTELEPLGSCPSGAVSCGEQCGISASGHTALLFTQTCR